ncbi:MAG: hypothetical protein AAGA99_23560 [Actinomycetota bacterium]
MGDGDGLADARRQREALLDATSALEVALSAPAADPEWPDAVRGALVDVDVTIRAHIQEMEGDDGLLARVRRENPRLANAVNRLVDQHLVMTQLTRKVVDRLDGAMARLDDDEVAGIREDAMSLLGAVVRYRQRGADLLYEAYQVDVGGPG